MFNRKMEYIIKSVPTDDKQMLEDLLNEMSDEGWDLYTMHEVEADDEYQYNCIFMRDKEQTDDTEEFDKIVQVNNFKSQMEKMLSANQILSKKNSPKEVLLITRCHVKLKNLNN